jgi:hypothetical protein
MKEIRRRTRVAGQFPGEDSALLLVTAPLKRIHEAWAEHRYRDMRPLLGREAVHDRRGNRGGCEAAWRQILQTDHVADGDNFFELGGDHEPPGAHRVRAKRDIVRTVPAGGVQRTAGSEQSKMLT